MNQEVKKAGHPYLFRFRPDNDNTLNEILNSYVYFSDRSSLNDPFDSSNELVNFTPNTINLNDYFALFEKGLPAIVDKNFLVKNYSSTDLIKLIKANFPKYLDAFGIACFSMMPYINMALWATYANNHKGVCIQYLTDYDKVFFDNLGAVKYYKKLNKIDFNPIKDEYKILDVFYMKDSNWDHEKEIRLVKFKKGEVQIKNEAMRNIVCGYKSEDSYILKLIEISSLNHPHIGVYKMDKPKKQNAVSLTKLN